MKIFVDFDDVIFNAKKFKKDLIGVFRKNGITRQEFENSYYTFQKRAQEQGVYYDPKKQIQVLKKKYLIDHKRLQRDIDVFMEDLSGYVFPDVHEFLDSFKKKDLYLMTYGHEMFQRKKIRGSGIKKYFGHFFISKRNKIENVLAIIKKEKLDPDEMIVLIDDRPEQLERAEKVRKIIMTFRMCRKEGRYSDLICIDKDYEVKNFQEILEIIKIKNKNGRNQKNGRWRKS